MFLSGFQSTPEKDGHVRWFHSIVALAIRMRQRSLAVLDVDLVVIMLADFALVRCHALVFRRHRRRLEKKKRRTRQHKARNKHEHTNTRRQS